jgi:hypothetical protein
MMPRYAEVLHVLVFLEVWLSRSYGMFLSIDVGDRSLDVTIWEYTLA